MLAWIIYDICNDKVRNKISKICLKKGLSRVQKSVFLGSIDETKLKACVAESEALIDKKTDSIYIFPLCQEDFKKVQMIGLAFDKAKVNDEIKQLFV